MRVLFRIAAVFPLRRACQARREGMTLLEILLTLSLLVVLAAVTWPALGRPMARQRLRESADQVRTEWVRMRVHAMSSNRTYVFQYEPEGSAYAIEAYESDEEAAWAVSFPGNELDAGTDDAARQRRIADKTRFVAGQAAATDAATSSGGDGQRIFFYPDGTCSDAQLQLANEYGDTITLSLRGLTGVVTVSEVLATEAAAP